MLMISHQTIRQHFDAHQGLVYINPYIDRFTDKPEITEMFAVFAFVKSNRNALSRRFAIVGHRTN